MNNLILIATLICALLIGISACAQKEKSNNSTSDNIVQVLEVDSYLSQLNQEKRSHHFVDVRTPEEVADGTIEGAINIDYKGSGFIEQFSALDKDQPVYLFCRSGNRSGKATKLLIKEGYKEIYDLKGGYLAFEAAQ